jgi:lysophospholipase L1-like esterase
MRRITLLVFLFLFFKDGVHAQAAPAFWQDMLAFKKQDSIQPPPRQAILFIGSSTFTKWKDIADYFPEHVIINRGFGGSTLVDVIRYAYEIIFPYRPKQVVIYCGENDLASADSVTAAEVVSRFKTLYGMIRQNLPDAMIDFVSIKPSPSREKIQPKVKVANKEISAFLKTQKKAAFIDIYPAMLDAGGKIRETLFIEDRLHMNREGYQIWKKIIQPYLLR